MGRITEITYGKLFTYGKMNHTELKVTSSVELDDNAVEVLQKLAKFVKHQYGKIRFEEIDEMKVKQEQFDVSKQRCTCGNLLIKHPIPGCSYIPPTDLEIAILREKHPERFKL